MIVFRRRLTWLFILLIVLLAATIAIDWYRRGAAVPIPRANVSEAHPRVAEYVEKLYQQVVDQPRSEEAWGLYGRALMAHHWYDEADASFRRAAELNGREMRWPYYRAVIAERRDLTQADQLYSAAAAIDDDYGPLHQRWGELLMRLDRYAEAAKQFERAAQLATDQPHPHIGLGRVAMSQNEFEEAERHFARAVELGPENLEARAELARVRFRLGKADADEYAKSLASSSIVPLGMPDGVLAEISEQERAALRAATEADELAASGNVDAAADAYRKLVSDRPDLARPRLNLATMMMARGDLAGAIRTYQEVVNQFPDDALAHYALGSALEQAGQLVEAMRAYKESVRLKPDYAQAHFARGLLFERNRQFKEAVDSYRKAVHSDPRLAPAQLALGVALQREGKLVEAITHIENAVALFPEDPVPRQYLERAKEALAKSNDNTSEQPSSP